MSNFENSFRNDAEALIDLLEDIVASYQDNDSRPADALRIYRQHTQLDACHRATPAKRFVVIQGGASRRAVRRWRKLKLDQPHLRLMVPSIQTLGDPQLP